MGEIIWEPKLATGVTKVDAQHQVLIDALNGVAGAIAQRDSALLVARLDFLAEYTAKHFRMEEALMLTYRYEGYVRHKHLHDEMLSQVEDIRAKVETFGGDIPPAVMVFLEGWLMEHIQGEDWRLGRYLQAFNVPD